MKIVSAGAASAFALVTASGTVATASPSRPAAAARAASSDTGSARSLAYYLFSLAACVKR